jgi:hypothetical protein
LKPSKIIPSALTLLIIIISCQTLLKEDIYIEPSEIGIYYDSDIDKTIVLKTGKHKIPKRISLNIYPIDDNQIKQNLEIITKDKKGKVYGLNLLWNLI